MTTEPVDTAGIPAELPAPAPHGPFAPEDAVRAGAFKEWAATHSEGGQKDVATHVKAVQVVESGDAQLVYLHTDLPPAEGDKPHARTADLLAVYEAWPQRPATAFRIGAFDAKGHRLGTAGVPAPTPPGP
ncbi:hypothetical protein [Streptomyces sp. NBC_00158]|uniref:hypothetical protein n=1 Tax=Streptomyces sp. NBC_00158 TaxID=2903627 RepID=UPI00324CBCE8